MTEENELRQVRYLDRQDLETVHATVSERFKEEAEAIPPFSSADEHNLDALVKTPQSRFFGIEQYPDLASKAAIIFFTVNKKHIFENGNKRLSVAYLTVFLSLNGRRLDVTEDELTEKALWLARTTHEHSFPEIKDELTQWIGNRTIDEDEPTQEEIEAAGERYLQQQSDIERGK